MLYPDIELIRIYRLNVWKMKKKWIKYITVFCPRFLTVHLPPFFNGETPPFFNGIFNNKKRFFSAEFIICY